jgi:hypothetical protein
MLVRLFGVDSKNAYRNLVVALSRGRSVCEMLVNL